jgi:hypothetical protein
MFDKDSIKWFLEQLGDADMAFLRHPDRCSIKEEAEFIKMKVKKRSRYLKIAMLMNWQMKN